MARFVAVHTDGITRATLQAGDGEELTPEQVAAYAALKQAWALEDIANKLVGIDNALMAISSAVVD
ncbi:hypothetical protein IAG41_16155 [Sphingomonas sp. JC676]|uniref:hypothetical protein n=1 Tax=Sphingomonas sp. JC676 TaxID=2768065 RepID=UPI0016579E15|nr:hypothetical protein [Sphingomonas sp. JC676]MBC9033924.1 hypothetical protein [Sphingomonas sp. JC676]